MSERSDKPPGGPVGQPPVPPGGQLGEWTVLPAGEDIEAAESGTGENELLVLVPGAEASSVPPEVAGLLQQVALHAREIARFAKKHRVAVPLGVAAAGSVLLDLSGTLHEALPVAGVAGTAEAAWIGGAVLALLAVGKEIPRNPLKVREAFGNIAAAANNSPLFWVGLTINTVAAVVQGTVPPVIIIMSSPPEGWGKILPFLADLGLTIMIRRGVIQAVRSRGDDRQA
jgi:hypothetical protein